jgi:hypothetical protein
MKLELVKIAGFVVGYNLLPEKCGVGIGGIKIKEKMI